MKTNLTLASCLLLASFAGGCNDDGSSSGLGESARGFNGNVGGRLVMIQDSDDTIAEVELGTGRFSVLAGTAETIEANGLRGTTSLIFLERDPSNPSGMVATIKVPRSAGYNTNRVLFLDGEGRMSSPGFSVGSFLGAAAAKRSWNGRFVAMAYEGGLSIHDAASGEVVSSRELDGTARFSYYDWLPDGRLVVALPDTGGAPVLMVTEPYSVIGANDITLPSRYTGSISDLRVSPDGNRVVVNPRGRGEQIGPVVIDVRTLDVYEPVALREDRSSKSGNYLWSPNGDRLLLQQRFVTQMVGVVGLFPGTRTYAVRVDGGAYPLPDSIEESTSEARLLRAQRVDESSGERVSVTLTSMVWLD